jgi:hypothetical protein
MWKVCSTIEGKQAAQRDDGKWRKNRLYVNLKAPVIKWVLKDYIFHVNTVELITTPRF